MGSEVPPGESSARGWADLAKDPHLPNRKEPILIVQHPEREQKPPPQMPLQIAFATPGFEGDNSNGTRLLYTPSTRVGHRDRRSSTVPLKSSLCTTTGGRSAPSGRPREEQPGNSDR